MNIDDLKKTIIDKKHRLFLLKKDGFFRAPSFVDARGHYSKSTKYASLECQRRRREIRDLEKDLLKLLHEHNRNIPK